MNSNKTITCAVLAVLSVLLFSERNCLADIENQIRSSSSSGDAGWGQGKMKVSERYYYEGRFRIIMDRWRDIAWNSKTDREGRLVQPHHAYLHIDLDKEAIWIEDQGKVRQEDYMELPSHMKWELHHLTEHAKTRLPASVCLKNRGKYTSRLFREIIYLIGNGRGGDHLDFRIESANSNSDYGGGPGPAITLLPKSNKKQEKEPYGSILVSEEEYAEYVEKRAPDTNGSRLQDNDKDVGRWSSTQKRIYQQIEVEIGKRDYELRKIEHNRAIDYSAMLAKVNCKRKDRSWDFLPLRRSRVTGPYNMDFLVKADHLGQGVWYAKSYPYMHGTGQTDFLEMDFIVHGTAKMSKRVYKDWIAKGQSKHNVSLDSKSEWSVALADGTRVEFVGVKRGSVVGGQCWGPDGSLLGHDVLFYDDDAQDDVCHMLLKIEWASGTTGSVMESYFDDKRGWGSSRGGSHKDYEIVNVGYRPDKAKKHTTMKLVISSGGGKEETVHFKNISLEAENAFGFEIMLDE